MSLASKDPCGLVMQSVDYIVACVGSVSHSIEGLVSTDYLLMSTGISAEV